MYSCYTVVWLQYRKTLQIEEIIIFW